jgi:SAM-dependent methyltransferase
MDVACGAGRNAVWLAQHGWRVVGCDISLEGLRKAKALAARQGAHLDLYAQDLDSAVLPENHFDLIICFFYLRRELFPILKAALCRGGFIAFKTYTTDQQRFPGRPSHPLHFLRPQELLEAVLDFRVLYYEEIARGRGVAQLIAQKAD